MTKVPIVCLPAVMFRSQGQCFAFEAQYVRQQGQVDEIKHAGLVNAADLLVGNLSNTAIAVQWLALQSTSGVIWQLALPAPAELIELSATSIYPLPLMLQARRLLPALQALACYQGELVALLNVDVLQAMSEGEQP